MRFLSISSYRLKSPLSIRIAYYDGACKKVHPHKKAVIARSAKHDVAISFLRWGFPRQFANGLGMTVCFCSGGLALESSGESPLTMRDWCRQFRNCPNTNCGMIATGNHLGSNSLRGAPRSVSSVRRSSSIHSTAKGSPDGL